jgi:hypothetical protein
MPEYRRIDPRGTIQYEKRTRDAQKTKTYRETRFRRRSTFATSSSMAVAARSLSLHFLAEAPPPSPPSPPTLPPPPEDEREFDDVEKRRATRKFLASMESLTFSMAAS